MSRITSNRESSVSLISNTAMTIPRPPFLGLKH